VWVGTKPNPNGRSSGSIFLNPWFRYYSLLFSKQVTNQWVVIALSTGSICGFLYCTCVLIVLTLIYYNYIFNINESVFACCAVCDNDYFDICVLLLVDCIFGYKAVNSSIISSNICAIPILTNLQYQQLLMLWWLSYSWWGDDDITPVSFQNANITSYLNQSHTVTHKLLKMQCQNSSRLRWCPFRNGGSDSVALCFAYNSSQYFGHAWQRPNLFLINFLTRSTIVDIQLTLTFWMGQWWCRALFAYNSCHDVRYAWQWPNLFSNTFLSRLRIAND